MNILDATSFLTIVSYHYVRPIRDSKYALIKGLEKTDFEGQMEYIMRHYNVVSMEHVVASIRGEEPVAQVAQIERTGDKAKLLHWHEVKMTENNGFGLYKW